MSNLAIWNAVDRTDPKYTKSFNRSGFEGTAINPTWMAKQATDKFGPMGLGWGLRVLDEKYQEGAPGTVVHIIRCELWYLWEGKTGTIEVYGQTTFSGKRNNGQSFTDEEAPKKSLTDAMTKGLSLLGFAADVHLGLYDDSKYVRDLKQEFSEAANEQPKGRTIVNDQPVGGEAPKMAESAEEIDMLAAEIRQRIADCTDEKALTKLMTSAEIRKKLSALPSDVKDKVRNYSIEVLNDLNAKKKAG